MEIKKTSVSGSLWNLGFFAYFLCPPSAHRKKVGRLSPPLPKIGCKVPLHL